VREIDILKEISAAHSNINTLRDLFDDGVSLLLVLDYVDGGELFDLIMDVGNFEEEPGRYIIKQLVSAVRYMHANNVVHRECVVLRFPLPKICVFFWPSLFRYFSPHSPPRPRQFEARKHSLS
jgi:Protein kinase domain